MILLQKCLLFYCAIYRKPANVAHTKKQKVKVDSAKIKISCRIFQNASVEFSVSLRDWTGVSSTSS